jgi:hypothetical protein
MVTKSRGAVGPGNWAESWKTAWISTVPDNMSRTGQLTFNLSHAVNILPFKPSVGANASNTASARPARNGQALSKLGLHCPLPLVESQPLVHASPRKPRAVSVVPCHLEHGHAQRVVLCAQLDRPAPRLRQPLMLRLRRRVPRRRRYDLGCAGGRIGQRE